MSFNLPWRPVGYYLEPCMQVPKMLGSSPVTRTSMWKQLACVSLWLHRNVISSKMTPSFLEEFSNYMVIIVCIEIIKLVNLFHSKLNQINFVFTRYKSSTSLKALVCSDSRECIMWMTPLFPGIISDSDTFKGVYDYLAIFFFWTLQIV